MAQRQLKRSFTVAGTSVSIKCSLRLALHLFLEKTDSILWSPEVTLVTVIDLRGCWALLVVFCICQAVLSYTLSFF